MKITNPTNTTNSGQTIMTVAKVDDVAGDGSGALINFVELWTINTTSGSRTKVADVKEDLSAAYTVLGTRRNSQDIGSPAKTDARQIFVTTTWAPTSGVLEFTYSVLSVTDTLNPPTFKDSDGIITDLHIGEERTFTAIDGTLGFNSSQILITANSGTVKVSYIEISS